MPCARRRLGHVDTFLAAAAALAPPIGVGFLFWLAIRALMNADRTERTAMARLEAEEAARRRAAAAQPGRVEGPVSAPARPVED